MPLKDRIRERLTRVFGPAADPNAPASGDPLEGLGPPRSVSMAPTPPDNDVVDPGLMARIVNRIRRYFGPKGPPRVQLPTAPPSIPEMNMIIAGMGRHRTLVYMAYSGGMWRHVEPYSFRKPGKTRPNDPLDFMGYCRIHDSIHRFMMKRITGMLPTDEPFEPRWPPGPGGLEF